MGHSNAIRHEHREPRPVAMNSRRLQDDPRWQLAQRVVVGSHFARSALLSKFLLFVVREALEGREAEITEHLIGVHVFDRRPSYSTVEDNIVRTDARQLRKRLFEHFSAEGSAEPLRIDVPVGGYVPIFFRTSDVAAAEAHGRPVPVSINPKLPPDLAAPPNLTVTSHWNWRGRWLHAALLTAYSIAIICATWFVAARIHTPLALQGRAHPLWAALFQGPADTYIVPADAGFNLLEDLSHRPLELSDYIQSGYLKLPLAGVDEHSADDLRSQQFTSFVDLQTVTALARLPEYNPQRVMLRFPRDLRLDDLKNSNVILIGSVGSNPWASIGESNANFRIVYGPGMQGATIINAHPLPGETPSYVSHWSEPAHETFALIAFLPNLGGNGRLLLLQGLDVAGTQAAAEALIDPVAIDPILRRATRPDGSLRFFEILLRSTSIESSSAGTKVIASRIY